MSELQEQISNLTLSYLTQLSGEAIGSEEAKITNEEFYKFAQSVEKLSNGVAKMTESEVREKELEIRQQEADSKRMEANAKAEEVKIKAEQVANDKAKAEADQKLKAEEINVKKVEIASRQKTEIKRYVWEGVKVGISCVATAGLTVFCTMASEKGWFTNKAGLAQVPKIRF